MEEKEKIEELQKEINEKRSIVMALQIDNRNLSKTLENYNRQIEIYEMIIRKLCGEKKNDVF